MDELTLAKILERTAKQDQFDGVGRILLSDLNYTLPEKITGDQVVQTWQNNFPMWRIEQRTPNVILVFFENSENRLDPTRRGARMDCFDSFPWEE